MKLNERAILAVAGAVLLAGVALTIDSQKWQHPVKRKELDTSRKTLKQLMERWAQSAPDYHTPVTGRMNSSRPNMANFPKTRKPPEPSVYEQLAAIEPAED